MPVLPRRSWASDASYIWSAEADERPGVGCAVSPGAGGPAAVLSICAPRASSWVRQLAQPLLALAGELLELHQLLLDVVEIGGDVALELADRLPAHRERVHDLPLHLDHLRQLRRPGRVPPRRLGPQQRDLALHQLDVALGDAPGQPRRDPEARGDAGGQAIRRGAHCGATRLSPPAVTWNSSRRFWA